MAGTTPTQQQAKRRICRTPEEAFAAGWADGANDRPLTADEAARIAALWRPYFRRSAA